MERFKSFMNKYKWFVIGGVVALIIIIVVATLLVKNHKIDVEDDVKVSFNGYNKTGTAEITDDSYEKIMNKLQVKALKQAGFKNKEVLNMIENNETDDLDEDDFNYEEQQQTRTAGKILEHVNLDIHNGEELKNKDKVTVKLTIDKGISKDYKLKVKEFTKSFKANGLKEPENIEAKDLFTALKPKFTGVNGAGSLNLISKDLPKSLQELSISNYDFTVANNGNLSNGDEVKLKIPQSLIDDINESGSSTFSGKSTQNIKVKGLKNISNLDNINELIDKNNTLIDKEYESDEYTKYNTENLGNYYKIQADTADEYSFGEEEDESSEKVSPVSEVEPTYVSLITAVKVTKTGKYSDPDVSYTYQGYNNYQLEYNRLVKDDMTDKMSMTSSKDKQDELNNDLKSDGFKEIK
ncbi:hypothetical protein [Staphylococcus arlettae]|uniref:hypothetical protein n=1 Tax=Staphylococcus arlettae TaxID=29378 RepID=UPI001BDC9806|nr:hypothetical protein [Staphylococcus arlettae]